MRLPLAVLTCAALLLAACSPFESGALRQTASPVTTASPEPVLAADVVDLTVYFRSGDDHGAHLEPVSREVSVEEDLPRQALELLLAGPGEGEDGLEAPLPPATRVQALEVDGGVAQVTLSPEAVREAASVGGSPGNEALALGALANTLTEFPSIDAVALTVEGIGIDSEHFWGGWGMPPLLVRDESLIGPSGEGRGLLDLGRFSLDNQTLGSENANPVEIVAVRVRDRLTHVRVAVELAATDGEDAAVKVPESRVRVSGDELVLVISGVATYSAGFDDEQPLALSSAAFEQLQIDHDGRTCTLRLRVADLADHPFWLHALSSPTRVVLDVKK
jgi:hypothetical protein